MSAGTFLAWSLLGAGAFALLYFVIERHVHAPEARVTGAFKRSVVALALIFAGAVITRDVLRLFATASPPAWSRLLSSAVPLVMGLFYLLTIKKGDTNNPLRVFAGILIAIGTVTLAVDGYHYAISLGTAASWGVR